MYSVDRPNFLWSPDQEKNLDGRENGLNDEIVCSTPESNTQKTQLLRGYFQRNPH